MYLLNNSRKWAEDTRGQLDVPTQNSIFSHVSKIKLCTKQDYYVTEPGIKCSHRLCVLRNQHK